MLALKVSRNGKKLYTAGVGRGVIYTEVICAVGDDDRTIYLDTSGLNHDDEENCRWADRKLRIGDQVEIKIVEVPRVDAPAKREAAQMTRAKHLRMQKQMVRRWAKELGWIIQTRPIKRKSVTRG